MRVCPHLSASYCLLPLVRISSAQLQKVFLCKGKKNCGSIMDNSACLEVGSQMFASLSL